MQHPQRYRSALCAQCTAPHPSTTVLRSHRQNSSNHIRPYLSEYECKAYKWMQSRLLYHCTGSPPVTLAMTVPEVAIGSG